LPHPDGLGTWAEDGSEVTFLLEYDTGTENLPRLTGKLAGYGHLASSLADAELACPPLLFCFPGPRREQAARRALAACYDTPGLRIATTAIDPEQTCPAGRVWLPLQAAGGPAVPLIGLDPAMPDPWTAIATTGHASARHASGTPGWPATPAATPSKSTTGHESDRRSS
jgi:hypothetical protein